MYTERISALDHHGAVSPKEASGEAGRRAGWLTSTQRSQKLPGVQTELPRVAEPLLLSDSAPEACPSCSGNVISQAGRGEVWALPSLGKAVDQLSICSGLPSSQPTQPLPFLLSTFLFLLLPSFSLTHQVEHQPKNLTKVNFLHKAHSCLSFGQYFSLSFNFPLSLLLSFSLITQGFQPQVSPDRTPTLSHT